MMNRKRLRNALLVTGMTFAAIPSAYAAAQAQDADSDETLLAGKKNYNEWVLTRNDPQYEVQTWAKQESGKRYRSFKIRAVLPCTPEQALKVQMDAENLGKWFWNTKSAVVIKTLSRNDLFYRQVFDGPLMSSDLDSIVHIVSQPYDAAKGYAQALLTATPDMLPVMKGIVRVQKQEMLVRFTPREDGSTQLEAEGYIDPGGNMPGWMINAIQNAAPYISTRGMQRWIKHRTGTF